MIKQRIIIPTLIFSVLILAACGTSSNIKENGVQVIHVSDEQTKLVVDAVNSHDNSKRLDIISDLQDYVSSQDPVFNNARGAAMLVAGEHQSGIASIRESLNILSRDSLLFTSDQAISSDFAYKKQAKFNKTVGPGDNAEVLDGLREFVQNGLERRLLRAIERWEGSLPAPPIFTNSGLPALALETINEVYGKKILKPYSVSYYNLELSFDSQYSKSIEKASINLLIGGILSGETSVIEEATEYLQAIPDHYKSPENQFLTGLGLYLIGDTKWSGYINHRYIAMFNN